jgi:hypothetical protein
MIDSSDAHEVLLHDPPGPKVHVPDLGVAHLPSGETDGQPRRLEQRPGSPRPERVPRRHVRHRDGIAFARLPVAKAIDDHEDNGTDFRTGHLAVKADVVDFGRD